MMSHFFIHLQTLSVLNPFRTPEKSIFEDTDMAGPLVFCLAFGGFLLLVSFCLIIKFRVFSLQQFQHTHTCWFLQPHFVVFPMINVIQNGILKCTIIIIYFQTLSQYPSMSVSVCFASVRKSDILVHLWNWSAWMFGILLSSFINGSLESDFGCCHFRFRILLVANGRVIWRKCINHNSVSWMSFLFYRSFSSPPFFFYLFDTIFFFFFHSLTEEW